MEPLEDRLPPNAPEAERAVLGCVLLEPKTVIPLVMEAEPIGANLFYDNRYDAIWEAMQGVFASGMQVDLVTLTNHMRQSGKLEQVGGIGVIADLPDQAPAVGSVQQYIDIIKSKCALRKIARTCTEIAAKAMAESGNSAALIATLQKQSMAMSTEEYKSQFIPVADIVDDTLDQLGAIAAGNVSPGLMSGYIDLDALTGGFANGELTILAARPSVGKTALALNIAERINKAGAAVGFFSLEMSRDRITERMLSSMAGVNMRYVRDGSARSEEIIKLGKAGMLLKSYPFFIDDASALGIVQLQAKARRLFNEENVKCFMVDYLQLVTHDAKSRDNRSQEVADVADGLKSLARELNIPVIALCQLNRGMEKEKARAPRLSDLRESGGIEQSADIVILMWCGSEVDMDQSHPVCLRVAKNRNGPVGDLDLTFCPQYTRFENVTTMEPKLPYKD